MTWRCVPVPCLRQIKHLAPKVLAGLLAASPPPVTACSSRCHWVWSGPLPAVGSPSPGVAAPPIGSPPLLLAPPPADGVVVPPLWGYPPSQPLSPPVVVGHPEPPPQAVDEPGTWILMLLQLAGLTGVLLLLRSARGSPRYSLRPWRKLS